MARDITGEKIGKLNVIRVVKIVTDNRGRKRRYWLCLCDCGNEKTIREDGLVSKNGTKSCGCLHKEKISKNIIGKRFGKLTVLEKTDERMYASGNIVWKCICDCGETCFKATALLNRFSNCGCKTKEFHHQDGLNKIDKLNSGCILDTNVRMLNLKKLKTNNTSGYTGVYFDKRNEYWYARITFRKKVYNLGHYRDKNEAIKVRKKAESMLFEPFLKWYKEMNGQDEGNN